MLGEFKSAVEMLTRGWQWGADRRDPARLQAARLIEAFEAHGIKRQQIARLLPKELQLPIASFSRPEKLKDKLTPELLDWAAEHLALRRPWLDGEESGPHRIVEAYKDPKRHVAWLEQRAAVAGDVSLRCILVWRSHKGPIGWESRGFLSVVYEETRSGLDEREVSRYWRLSDHWPLGHAASVEHMQALVPEARRLGILVLGKIVKPSWQRRFEEGRCFAHLLTDRVRGRWEPEDAVFVA